MQYLLTKEEFDKLVDKSQVLDRSKALEIARKRILKASGHKCWNEGHHGAYCDNCPCLVTKDERKDYENNIGASFELVRIHNLICPLNKNFSK